MLKQAFLQSEEIGLQRAWRSREGKGTKIALKILNGRKCGHEAEGMGRKSEEFELEEAADQIRRREGSSPMQTTSMKPYMP